MSALTVDPSNQASALVSASKNYGVPLGTLLGVFGQETTFGQNVATSSAGAMGPFQFTAANKGTGVLYPMTNTPSASQFGQQADAAAAYLAALYKQHGSSWDAALHAYSGGGYGQAEINAQGSKLPSSLKTPLGVAILNGGDVPGTAPGPFTPKGAANAAGNAAGDAAAGALSGVSGAISGVFNQLVTDAKYAAVLVGVLVVGVILITHGLTGATPRSAAAAVRGGTPA